MFPLYYYYNNTFLLQLFLINFINLYRFYYRQQQQRSRPQHISPRSQSRQNVCQNRPQTVHTVQSGRIQKNRQKSPIKKTFRSFGISSLLGLPTRIAKNSRAFGISELLSRKESNQQLGCNQPIHTAPQTNRKSGLVSTKSLDVNTDQFLWLHHPNVQKVSALMKSWKSNPQLYSAYLSVYEYLLTEWQRWGNNLLYFQ